MGSRRRAAERHEPLGGRQPRPEPGAVDDGDRIALIIEEGTRRGGPHLGAEEERVPSIALTFVFAIASPTTMTSVLIFSPPTSEG
jgi:hypothetical protein